MKCSTKVCSLSVKFAAIAATFITSGLYAQDECTTAVVATAGVPVAFSTTTATPSANIPTDALCAGTYLNWLATQNDVWFSFTATEGGTLSFDTCDVASYDTSMALYSGTCANLIACNGDGIGQVGCQAYWSRITDITCAAGDLFYIRIGGYEGAVGAGYLNVTFTASTAGCVGATGACNVAHGGLGCDNATCCAAICLINPLCCELGWDSACASQAITDCGYYYCPVVAGAPVNDCATNATVVPSYDSVQLFNTVNATTDGPDHPTGCSSGSAFFDKDIWWKVTPIANGTMTISSCGSSSYDNKLAVYDMGTNPATFNFDQLEAAVVFCNDDGPGGTCMLTDGSFPYASETSGGVQLGHTYLVRMGSYTIGDFGSGEARFTLPVACELASGSVNEGEGCGSAFNDGCNAAGETESVSMGSTVAGTFWADADTRDTDFYSFVVAVDSQVTVSVKAARLTTVFILSGDMTVAACAGVSILSTGTGSCPNSASICLNPGTYYAFVADAGFTGNPCGSGAFNNYSMEITAAPAVCAILVSGAGAVNGVCAAPGPNTIETDGTNPITVTQGLVACGVNPAAPNCSGGGTVANVYVRSIPAGAVTGDISCLNFGVFSVKRAVNGAACASFYSDIPLPSTIKLYRDLDGGAPRWPTANGGVDGNDLDLINSQAVKCAGGVYLATLNYSQPICVEEHVGYNLVVVMDNVSLYDGLGEGVPAASGYGIRAAGNTPAGTTSSNTYFSAPGCGLGLTAYGLTQSFGATFLAHWVVQVNGDNAAGCSAPACPGDFNGDGVRNGADLTTLLSGWGGPGGDINGDGTTNGADLTALLSGWGTCPN